MRKVKKQKAAKVIRKTSGSLLVRNSPLKVAHESDSPTLPAPIAGEPVNVGGGVRRFRNGTVIPSQKFQIGQVITVPIVVAESGKAKIVGCEWGPQYGKGKADCSGWLYWLVEVGAGGPAWATGESELVKWAKGNG